MKKPDVVDEEVTFEDVNVQNRPVISKTDLRGNITFVNSAFCKLSGYSKEELVGKPHNIVRHPDMPKEIFKEMWNMIEKNEKWRGFIKNLRKDGKYYWAETFIEPIFDAEGTKTGYISIRKPMNEQDKQKYEKIYKELKEKENQ